MGSKTKKALIGQTMDAAAREAAMRLFDAGYSYILIDRSKGIIRYPGCREETEELRIMKATKKLSWKSPETVVRSLKSITNRKWEVADLHPDVRNAYACFRDGWFDPESFVRSYAGECPFVRIEEPEYDDVFRFVGDISEIPAILDRYGITDDDSISYLGRDAIKPVKGKAHSRADGYLGMSVVACVAVYMTPKGECAVRFSSSDDAMKEFSAIKKDLPDKDREFSEAQYYARDRSGYWSRVCGMRWSDESGDWIIDSPWIRRVDEMAWQRLEDIWYVSPQYEKPDVTAGRSSSSRIPRPRFGSRNILSSASSSSSVAFPYLRIPLDA